jgi:hypothetical protein
MFRTAGGRCPDFGEDFFKRCNKTMLAKFQECLWDDRWSRGCNPLTLTLTFTLTLNLNHKEVKKMMYTDL